MFGLAKRLWNHPTFNSVVLTRFILGILAGVVCLAILLSVADTGEWTGDDGWM